MLASIFPNDPWATAVDALSSLQYIDETKSGSIENLKSMALETLISDDGKIGLGYVSLIGAKPTNDDIYAYWMRVSNIGGTPELRVVSRDTGFSGRWPLFRSLESAVTTMDAAVRAHNIQHTAARRLGAVNPQWPGEWLEFMVPPSQNPNWVAPSFEFRMFLNIFYAQFGGTNIRQLARPDAIRLATAIRTTAAARG